MSEANKESRLKEFQDHLAAGGRISYPVMGGADVYYLKDGTLWVDSGKSSEKAWLRGVSDLADSPRSVLLSIPENAPPPKETTKEMSFEEASAWLKANPNKGVSTSGRVGRHDAWIWYWSPKANQYKAVLPEETVEYSSYVFGCPRHSSASFVPVDLPAELLPTQSKEMDHKAALAWMQANPGKKIRATDPRSICSWYWGGFGVCFDLDDGTVVPSSDFLSPPTYPDRRYLPVDEETFGYPDQQPAILSEATPDPIKPPKAVDYPADAPGPGIKYDSNKVRVGLVPVGPILAIAEVMTYGAKKYSANNWQNVEPERYWDALLRHLYAWCEGEQRDPETGFLHLAHAATNVVFLLWFALRAEKK